MEIPAAVQMRVADRNKTVGEWLPTIMAEGVICPGEAKMFGRYVFHARRDGVVWFRDARYVTDRWFPVLDRDLCLVRVKNTRSFPLS